MHRRKLLQLLGATAVAAAYGSSARAARAGDHVVVIGAGILGAAISYHLVRRGAKVTILEKASPASGTTGDSFAYLNASTKSSSRPYFELNARGMAGWRRWQLEFGGALPLQWGGAVYWRDEKVAVEKLLSTLRICQEWGYPGRRVLEDELRSLLPKVLPGRVDGAVVYEEEGVVDPVGAVRVLLDRAKSLGATLRFPVEVKGIEVAGDRVRGVKTSEGNISADAVVVAAGLGSQWLANSLSVKLPLAASHGVLIHTAPQPKLLDSVVFAPNATVKQSLDGRIVSSSGHEGSSDGSDLQAQGQRILANAAQYFPTLKDAKIERVSNGQRVLPEDGFPVLGFAPKIGNLYLAVTHSGITLAPAIAQLATQEILDGIAPDVLAPFRPSRFT
jgi:glycine/D-amino acid oxidase-like deaminating enzyme